MPPPIPTLLELDRLLASAETTAKRRLLVAVIRVRQEIPLGPIERAILSENLEEAIRLVGIEPVLNAVAGLQGVAGPVRQAGWWDALRNLPAHLLRQPALLLSLGAHAEQSPAVMQRIATQDLTRIRAVSARTIAAIREQLTQGLAAGTPPRELARQLRHVVGLTSRQAASVERFRVRLVEEGRPEGQVDRMVDRFSRRQLVIRTENIARTEVMSALQGGKTAQWERLVASGTINPEDWEVEWVTADDERTCPICEPLHGARTAIGGTFVGRDGVHSGPAPAHPRCRCINRLVLKGFRRGQSPAPARERILRGAL
ncbi:MAG: phage head morphogenesis protein [Gemmatimonadales bacterium]|nr:phage head morphogenesis protein [Gemmatimonadales bacterium]